MSGEGRPLPVDVDPSEVAVDMLKAELPGFESRIVPERDALAIRGALPIANEVSARVIFYPLMRSNVFVDRDARNLLDALESDLARRTRHERQREALRHELAPVVEMIAKSVRDFGIEALGLKPIIEASVNAARIDGQRVGYTLGKNDGYRAGRDDGFAEGAEHERARLIRKLAIDDELDEIEDQLNEDGVEP